MAAYYPLPPDVDEADSEIKVICAGLPRCATNSLKHALQHLGYPTCHMMDILWWPARQRESIRIYQQADAEGRKKILRHLFKGFQACCDAPAPSFIDDLMDMYPNAKVILNQRADPKSWAQSFEQGIMFFCGWKYWFFGLFMTLDRLHCEFTTLYVEQLRRRFQLQDTKDWLQDAYVLHNEWVRDEAAKRDRRVLEWKPGDGWEPLCKFLDDPVPNVPFPHNNERSNLQRVHREQVEKGKKKWAALVSTVGVLALALAYAVK
ncbi:P-loop containing nucleoside triphosphate hydrolase protein [Xylariaceae sp. FL0016]|nr:P-loop containing nucleoside triphosphate hydrolase protein [Xylariaceae sp. FL0016]